MLRFGSGERSGDHTYFVVVVVVIVVVVAMVGLCSSVVWLVLEPTRGGRGRTVNGAAVAIACTHTYIHIQQYAYQHKNTLTPTPYRDGIRPRGDDQRGHSTLPCDHLLCLLLPPFTVAVTAAAVVAGGGDGVAGILVFGQGEGGASW